MQTMRENLKLGAALLGTLGTFLLITGSMAARNRPQLGEPNKLAAGFELGAGSMMLCLTFFGIAALRATRPGINPAAIEPPTSAATPSSNSGANIPEELKENSFGSVGTDQTTLENDDNDRILIIEEPEDLKETKVRSRNNSISFFVPPADKKSEIELDQYETIFSEEDIHEARPSV
jgi:hypothetical protein